MPNYKDSNNKLHFLDSAEYEYKLPAGCVEISDAEAEAIRLAAIMPPTTAELATSARAKRDSLISAVAWRYERHARELRLNLTQTDDIAVLDNYIEMLAEIPKSAGFPESITWPDAP